MLLHVIHGTDVIPMFKFDVTHVQTAKYLSSCSFAAWNRELPVLACRSETKDHAV